MPNDNNVKYIPLENANAESPNILDKLSEPRFNADNAKIVEEAKIGNLDDHVDITDPDYNDLEAQEIEASLSLEEK